MEYIQEYFEFLKEIQEDGRNKASESITEYYHGVYEDIEDYYSEPEIAKHYMERHRIDILDALEYIGQHETYLKEYINYKDGVDRYSKIIQKYILYKTENIFLEYNLSEEEQYTYRDLQKITAKVKKILQK